MSELSATLQFIMNDVAGLSESFEVDCHRRKEPEKSSAASDSDSTIEQTLIKFRRFDTSLRLDDPDRSFSSKLVHEPRLRSESIEDDAFDPRDP